MSSKISIIIPTYNEADAVVGLINYLKNNSGNLIAEIIISDGGSSDGTVAKALQAGALALNAPQKGRAPQMNFGALQATGNILYFVHADTFPPESFTTDIITALQQGYECGRYRTKFNSNKLLLKMNAFFTRFNWFICYGGDQTFFITQQLFTALNGYNTSFVIMEEYDLTARAIQQSRYKIFNKPALVSARKYDGRSWWQVQMANRKAVQLFKKGVSQEIIKMQYQKMLG